MKQVSCGNLTTDTDTETDTDIKKFLESVSVDWLEELKMEVEVEWRSKITTDTANTMSTRCFRRWRLTVKVKGLVC